MKEQAFKVLVFTLAIALLLVTVQLRLVLERIEDLEKTRGDLHSPSRAIPHKYHPSGANG